ncbi:unnamed protein product [Protopolystoma xenopodis]|uniref:Uncharacterized protein n=1 Tax=Protopolystoma xenopodis TaxID=117903 RepID=A0A3S5B2S8_9PLAT|nr:unnamed protein product [Protopolystoma xenopodis]
MLALCAFIILPPSHPSPANDRVKLTPQRLGLSWSVPAEAIRQQTLSLSMRLTDPPSCHLFAVRPNEAHM